MSTPPEHSAAVKKALEFFHIEQDAVLDSSLRIMRVAEGAFYSIDFLVLGAAKRYMSTAAAFRLMIEHWNMICARALLRMHIDTTLRFSAVWLVDNPHKFATDVLRGGRIDKMKDKKGNRLTDAYLVQVRSSELPWLLKVYENLSSYVHFSGAHIHASLSDLNENERTAHIEIGGSDANFPERSWTEQIDCFLEASAIFRGYLDAYAASKASQSALVPPVPSAEPRGPRNEKL